VREENTKLKKAIREAEEKLKKMEVEVKEAFNFVEEIVDYKGDISSRGPTSENQDDPMNILSRYNHESLLLIATEMGKKLRVIELERIEAKRYATDAKASKNQLDLLSKTHKELQEAHLQQAKFIQKLQKQNSEVEKYRETITTQEKVIAKMQKLVESRLKPPEFDTRPPLTPEVNEGRIDPKVAEEVFKLNMVLAEERNRYSLKETELTDAMREINKLKEQLWELETGGGNLEHVEKQLRDAEDALHAKDAELYQAKKRSEDLSSEVSTREMRISALEEQLVLSAQSSAKELSKLRNRIFELEVAMTSIENDPDVGSSGLMLEFDDDFQVPDFSNYKPLVGVAPDANNDTNGTSSSALSAGEGGAATKDDLAAGSALNAANALKPKVPNLHLDTNLEPIKEESRSRRHRRHTRRDVKPDEEGQRSSRSGRARRESSRSPRGSIDGEPVSGRSARESSRRNMRSPSVRSPSMRSPSMRSPRNPDEEPSSYRSRNRRPTSRSPPLSDHSGENAKHNTPPISRTSFEQGDIESPKASTRSPRRSARPGSSASGGGRREGSAPSSPRQSPREDEKKADISTQPNTFPV